MATLLATISGHAPQKRKLSTPIDKAAKKPRPHSDAPPRPQSTPLGKPHAAVLEELAAKYDVLPASVISSTPIRKRVARATTHLLGDDDGRGPRVVLLHARPAETCKMLTVAEMCKRLLEKEGGAAAWYQYNQLFDLSLGDAERARKRRGRKQVVEETVLHVDEEDGEEDEEDDEFETMQSRFERAVLPPAPDRTTKSLRIFLSRVPIPELKGRDGVTVQTSGK
ncbi:DNA/RNA-binding protein Alba-like protein [Cordyceps fumosorosea ARSEF 2679]|uniref:DNA/RNA-binding protein Alba-like protein n=1 Tax=Cordyceps fumosorosea (strain ARSEF 2679) TaxID=1081104 RepID=A0A167ND82_CORFA|nr:DNA/RNA-binding protein Alba-like protein [Cordyceps fumosorosea ARSEF 2679]OAA55421.1 DNA/RNA-binding protein Alba-like protein [Cordyceps fumosorosea ARSEF 2679]